MSQFSVISADNHVTLELHPDRWRLVQLGGLNVGTVLFEAAVGGEITYTTEFGGLRLLPANSLPHAGVQQVLLGWSPRLAAWQLGLLLTDTPAKQRGSRWVELARWSDPDGSSHSLAANRAGSALARVMHLPFKVIPPRLEGDAESAQEQTPPPPLPTLPLSLGQWSLERGDLGLRLIRQARWSRPYFQQIFWFSLWCVAFGVLSFLSLTVKLALPNAGALLPMPQLLPYLGFGVSAILLILIISKVRALWSESDEVIVSPDTRTVTAKRGSQQRWQTTSGKIAGVYASDVLTRRGGKYQIQHTELNLHLGERKFLHLIDSDYQESLSANGYVPKAQVTPLMQQDVHTNTQAAALYIAQALGDLPAWADTRTG